MDKLELLNLNAEIKKLFEEYTSRHESINNYYNPLLTKLNKEVKFYNWFSLLSLAIFGGGLFFGYYLYFTKDFLWYISIIPVVLVIALLMFALIKRRIYVKRKKKITKEFQKSIDEIEILASSIKRNTDAAVEGMLDSFLDEREEVIRIIGTSYYDLLEFYDYYMDFIEKNPNEVPKIKRIKEIKYSFEHVLSKSNFNDDEVISYLINDINKETIVDIIHLINNYNLNYRLRITAYIISYLFNSTLSKSLIKECYDLLTLNIDDNTISGFNFYAYLRDSDHYNLRQYKKYLKNIDPSTIYYDLITFMYRNKVYKINTHKDKSLILMWFIKSFYRYLDDLSTYEINTLLCVIFSIDVNLTDEVIKKYYKLYNQFFNVSYDYTLIKIYQRLVVCNLYLKDFEKASSYLDRIEKKEPNNVFLLTNRVLIKYRFNSFQSLFKRYRYKELPEFIQIENIISQSKDIDLINDLYDFKHYYLDFRLN